MCPVLINSQLTSGLPAGQLYTDTSTNQEFYNPGFPIGHIIFAGHATINNHFDIHIQYHLGNGALDGVRVTGVIVNPKR